jgi:hypothetical protein
MMKRIGLLTAVLLAAWFAPAQTPNVTGNWRVTISTSDGEITGKAGLKQSEESVTGWVGPSETDPITVTGALKGNKLTLKTFPRPGRNVAFSTCELTVDGDKMTGTIDTDKGKIEFVRTVQANH